MSTPQQRRGRGPGAAIRIPGGVSVARFDDYPRAQAAVRTLAEADLPMRQVSIVGDGLTSVERVTGAMSYGRAALNGALVGSWAGIVLALVLVLIDPEASLASPLAALVLGAGFGVAFRLATFSVTRRRRPYTSVVQVVASSYDVVVDPSVAASARRALGSGAPDSTGT